MYEKAGIHAGIKKADKRKHARAKPQPHSDLGNLTRRDHLLPYFTVLERAGGVIRTDSVFALFILGE